MDFVLGEPGHLAHASERRLHVPVGRWFRVVHGKDRDAFE